MCGKYHNFMFWQSKGRKNCLGEYRKKRKVIREEIKKNKRDNN